MSDNNNGPLTKRARMDKRLKRAFQITKPTAEVTMLNNVNSEILIELAMLEKAKQNLTTLASSRTKLLNRLLLQKFNYMISPGDIVDYNEQLEKIYVYEAISDDPYKERIDLS